MYRLAATKDERIFCKYNIFLSQRKLTLKSLHEFSSFKFSFFNDILLLLRYLWRLLPGKILLGTGQWKSEKMCFTLGALIPFIVNTLERTDCIGKNAWYRWLFRSSHARTVEAVLHTLYSSQLSYHSIFSFIIPGIGRADVSGSSQRALHRLRSSGKSSRMPLHDTRER